MPISERGEALSHRQSIPPQDYDHSIGAGDQWHVPGPHPRTGSLCHSCAGCIRSGKIQATSTQAVGTSKTLRALLRNFTSRPFFRTCICNNISGTGTSYTTCGACRLAYYSYRAECKRQGSNSEAQMQHIVIRSATL